MSLARKLCLGAGFFERCDDFNYTTKLATYFATKFDYDIYLARDNGATIQH